MSRGCELLRSLDLCGAARCPATKSGCAMGCANASMMHLFGGKNPGAWKVPTGASPVASPRRGEAARATSPPPVVRPGPSDMITEFAQQVRLRFPPLVILQTCYDAMLRRLEETLTSSSSPDQICLLSLDGGGIRGLIIIQA